MALRLGRNGGTERMRLRVAEALAENGLPAAMIHDLWPASGPDAVTTVAGAADLPAPFPEKDRAGRRDSAHRRPGDTRP